LTIARTIIAISARSASIGTAIEVERHHAMHRRKQASRRRWCGACWH